jgi:hypothetical protein
MNRGWIVTGPLGGCVVVLAACGGGQVETLDDVKAAVAGETGAERVVCDEGTVETGAVIECSADGNEYRATIGEDGGVTVERSAVIQLPEDTLKP